MHCNEKHDQQSVKLKLGNSLAINITNQFAGFFKFSNNFVSRNHWTADIQDWSLAVPALSRVKVRKIIIFLHH